VAASFISLIADLSDLSPVRVAGSVRRRKARVNDIELVTCASNRAALLARLDKLVLDGVCTKATYQNYTHRWDVKYAGIIYQDVRIELFGATPDNLGYITWLRTGPGDANTYVMQSLGGWPVRFDDGYAWTATYTGGTKTLVNKLRVPDERTFFNLLGISDKALVARFGMPRSGVPEFPPNMRGERPYAQMLKKTPPTAEFIQSLIIPNQTPTQKGMF
jgi:hypothetical protein